jgi:Secretion system C-terminal sorting domain
MKIFYPLIITLLLSSTAYSQERTSTSADLEANTKIIKFYPNPATSIINFDFTKGYDKSYTFQIFNFLGKKVYEVSNVTPRTIVNLTDFYRGVYIFQLKDKSGKMIDSGKFQVSK